MPIFSRAVYAFYLLIAVSMIAMLTLSIAEGLGVVRDLDIPALIFHPLYLGPVLVIGFVLAPWIAGRVPVSGDPENAGQGSRRTYPYPIRILALGILALVLAAGVNLAVFLLGKFT